MTTILLAIMAISSLFCVVYVIYHTAKNDDMYFLECLRCLAALITVVFIAAGTGALYHMCYPKIANHHYLRDLEYHRVYYIDHEFKDSRYPIDTYYWIRHMSGRTGLYWDKNDRLDVGYYYRLTPKDRDGTGLKFTKLRIKDSNEIKPILSY